MKNYHTYRTNSVEDFFVIRDKFRTINLFTISISDNFIIFQIHSDRNYDWFYLFMIILSLIVI